MYCVGLTGPIASGKSTVAMLFAKLGVDLIEADLIAKQLTAKDQPALASIIAHFGQEFLDSEGELHRRLLRDMIFKHPQERIWLEQLLHPLIRQAIQTRLQIPPTHYYMIEIPLLADKSCYPYLNRTLVVLANPLLQTQRVMQRDQHTAKQVEAIIAAQASEDFYQSLADDIVLNTESICDLEQSVLQLHKKYLRVLSLKESRL